MKIRKMIEIIGDSRENIAKRAGISVAQLNNNVSQGVDVEELMDGRFVTVRSNATYFEREDEAN